MEDEAPAGTSPSRTVFAVTAVLISCAIAAAVYVVASQRPEVYSSSAKVAFVEDTRFDYVDAERDRLIGLTESPAGRNIRDQEGVVEVSFDRPTTETFFDIEVRAEDPTLATQVAADLANLMVEADLAWQTEPITQEIEILEQRNAELLVEIDELTAAITADAQTEAEAEANRIGSNEAGVGFLTSELRRVQDRRFLNVRLREPLLTLQQDSLARISTLAIDVETTTAATRVVRPANEALLDSMTPASLAAVGGLASMIVLTALALLVAPYRRGDKT